MVGYRVISLATVAVFARAAVAQVPMPVPEAMETPISGLYLDPSIWVAVPGPSLGLQIALGYQRDIVRIGGFFGTGRLSAPHNSVDTETGYFGPELELSWPVAGFLFGPRVAAASGGSDSKRFSIGARLRYHSVSLGFDVVHGYAPEPTPNAVGYPSGTVVELGLGVSFRGTRRVAVVAGVGIATFVAVLGLIGLALQGDR